MSKLLSSIKSSILEFTAALNPAMNDEMDFGWRTGVVIVDVDFHGHNAITVASPVFNNFPLVGFIS